MAGWVGGKEGKRSRFRLWASISAEKVGYLALRARPIADDEDGLV
jgi:hypothetical protein